MGLGLIHDCENHMKRALELLGWPVPRNRFRLGVALAGQVLRQVRHRWRPKRHVGSWQHSPRAETALEAANACDRLMRVCFWSGDVLLMFYSALRNINLAERVGPCAELATAYASLLGMTSLVPMHSAAETYSRLAYGIIRGQGSGNRSQESSRLITDPSLLTPELPRAAHHWPTLMDGIYRTQIGAWDNAKRAYAAGETVLKEIGAVRELEESYACQAATLCLAGDFAGSVERARQSFESGARRGDTQTQCFGLLHAARSLFRLGRLDEAREALETKRKLIGRIPDQTMEIETEELAATSCLLAGDLAGARVAADSAARLIQRSAPLVWYLIPAYDIIATVYLVLSAESKVLSSSQHSGLGTQHSALKEAGRACKTLFKCAKVLRICQPCAWRHWGELHWMAGNSDRAVASWHKSRQLAQQLQMPYDEGLVHLELGRHLAETAEKREHIARALELLAPIANDGPIMVAAKAEWEKVSGE
jgi:hypothetical protein